MDSDALIKRQKAKALIYFGYRAVANLYFYNL